jgi:hypothetical protein
MKFLLAIVFVFILLSNTSLSELELVYPKGGEKISYYKGFINIEWKGIPTEDTISIDYGEIRNNQLYWYNITQEATGHIYQWVLDPFFVIHADYIRIRKHEQGYSSQTPKVEWSMTYGGSEDDVLLKIIETDDGNYVLLGYTYSNISDIISTSENRDIFIAKIDRYGNFLWKKYRGGMIDDYGTDIEKTSDGGFILVGYTNSKSFYGNESKGLYDAFVMKLNEYGNVIWTKTFGGSSHDRIRSVDIDEEDNIIFAINSTSQDFEFEDNNGINNSWIYMLDKEGNTIWEERFGGDVSDEINDIKFLRKGDIIAVGTAMSDSLYGSFVNGVNDIWILKIDLQGNMIESNLIGDKYEEEGKMIIETEKNDLIVLADNDRYDANSYFIKQSSSQEYISTRFFGYQDLYSIRKDGEFYLTTGYTSYNYSKWKEIHGYSSGYVNKIDSDVVDIWEGNYGGSESDYFYDVARVDDGFLCVGASQSNDQDLDSNKGKYDFWILKLGPEGKILQEDITDPKIMIFTDVDENEIPSKLMLYPNPTSNKLNIEFNFDYNEEAEILVLSNLGEIVIPARNKWLSQGMNSLEIDVSNLYSSSYILLIKTKSGILTKSFIKLK